MRTLAVFYGELPSSKWQDVGVALKELGCAAPRLKAQLAWRRYRKSLKRGAGQASDMPGAKGVLPNGAARRTSCGAKGGDTRREICCRRDDGARANGPRTA
ncbi:hypothetical protein [Pseudovibrio sp. SPO723]|uniref:hypothetical protein n=1 Tax=Nesiotobacter zosterae TaxID=392721 RepID=UPI0029C2BD04|nr:hypothetical protein [Pseudovibrio sp. SPO723]MDX5595591.1 hypothetical protein [Pseudovibrio sp. SPO723]